VPFVHGSKSSVYIDGLDVSPYLNAADWSTDQDTAEVTTFGSSWKSYIAGEQGAKISFTGFYDPLVLDLENLITDDWSLTNGVLTYCPKGSAIGDDARLFSVGATNYGQTSPIGGAVAIKWEPEVSSQVGFGSVLHPMGTDTNTTTGAGQDNAVQSATGWIAHLHVTGITGGGSWVIKLQDSTTNSGFVDVTGAAFTTTAVKSSQRLVSATNTTVLRRWLIYVATRTGGSAGDSIHFQLSVARNS
jgi:hypothetical protein